jgi:hypothetical protein
MTGATLEELSTRETEMSIHESSFMSAQKARAQSRNSNIKIDSQSEGSVKSSGIFGNFFQSLLKPSDPDDDPDAIASCSDGEGDYKKRGCKSTGRGEHQPVS